MQIVTANRLIDGRVVFLSAEGRWVEAVEQAQPFTEAPALEAALAGAKRDAEARIVVEPYAILVTIDHGRVVPKELREKIRAGGPTVPSDFTRPLRRSVAA